MRVCESPAFVAVVGKNIYKYENKLKSIGYKVTRIVISYEFYIFVFCFVVVTHFYVFMFVFVIII